MSTLVKNVERNGKVRYIKIVGLERKCNMNEKDIKKTLSGGKLAGDNPENGRVEHDYYATNPMQLKCC